MIDLPAQLDLSVRLLVAALLGLAIGFEREIHGHPAGLRTHMLVALGGRERSEEDWRALLGANGFRLEPRVPGAPLLEATPA